MTLLKKPQMTKEKVTTSEKFEKTDFDLFEALAAIDKKDYAYYDRLTLDQQKKFVPFMMLHWISATKSNANAQKAFLKNTDIFANKYMFSEFVQKHPKLQWLMLVAASPGVGKQFHQWIPHIKDKVSKLKEKPKKKEIKDYYQKVYPRAASSDINEIADVFLEVHEKKMYLADRFPEMKFDEIDLLSEIITDDTIEAYEKAWGNI